MLMETKLEPTHCHEPLENQWQAFNRTIVIGFTCLDLSGKPLTPYREA